MHFTYGAITLYGWTFQTSLIMHTSSDERSTTPELLLVWPSPRSLAATWGIDVSFSSSGYLDVSVLRVSFIKLCIYLMMIVHCHNRVSTFGNLRVNGYLLLTVAYRSLSRPSSAPSAKASALCSYSLDQ